VKAELKNKRNIHDAQDPREKQLRDYAQIMLGMLGFLVQGSLDFHACKLLTTFRSTLRPIYPSVQLTVTHTKFQHLLTIGQVSWNQYLKVKFFTFYTKQATFSNRWFRMVFFRFDTVLMLTARLKCCSDGWTIKSKRLEVYFLRDRYTVQSCHIEAISNTHCVGLVT